MRLLIIGELEGQFGSASLIASQKGAKVRQAPTIDAALEQLRTGQGADLIMMDVRDPIENLITNLTNERIHIPVVGCGFDNNSHDAVRAIKAGAKEYLPLPPDEELIAAVLAAVAQDSSSMISHSPAMKDVIALADKVASSHANVLITGESGTGKEVMSCYIHTKSNRASKPFISVNCAAIPENLIESELFGHEKGAFTGAVSSRVGKFEESNGGTLLLDEISEIELRLQAKLLRAIQEQEITRVGGSKTVKLDLRIIATSNRDLKTEIAEGRFREDLFFRLNIISLQLPSLRDRKEDITQLSESFIKKYVEMNGIEPCSLSPEAEAALLAYSWPGNVRELENTMHRSVLLASGGLITPDILMLPEEGTSESQEDEATTQEGGGQTLETIERKAILSTLDQCLGNRTHAANILGISIKTLRNKLNQYTEEGHI